MVSLQPETRLHCETVYVVVWYVFILRLLLLLIQAVYCDSVYVHIWSV